jgi:hypothetical protein
MKSETRLLQRLIAVGDMPVLTRLILEWGGSEYE